MEYNDEPCDTRDKAEPCNSPSGSRQNVPMLNAALCRSSRETLLLRILGLVVNGGCVYALADILLDRTMGELLLWRE